MTTKVLFLSVTLSLFSLISFSQNLIPSYAYIQTCYNKQDCYSIGNSAFLYLNHSNNEFILQVDFSKFKLGNDTLDEWLENLTVSQLIFKGSLNTSNSAGLSHPLLKPINVNGFVTFNGITKPYHMEIVVSGNSQSGLNQVGNPQNNYDIVNASLQLLIHPKDFKVVTKSHHYKNKITIAISRGYLNELTPQLEHLILEKH